MLSKLLSALTWFALAIRTGIRRANVLAFRRLSGKRRRTVRRALRVAALILLIVGGMQFSGDVVKTLSALGRAFLTLQTLLDDSTSKTDHALYLMTAPDLIGNLIPLLKARLGELQGIVEAIGRWAVPEAEWVIESLLSALKMLANLVQDLLGGGGLSL